jgi:glucokinase
VLDKWEIPTRTENNGSAILPDVAESILEKIKEKQLDKAEIAGVGIGVPGPVNDKGEVECAVNLHWGYTDVEGDLSALTGLPVKAGNDANVAALGELWKGGGAGFHSMIMVTLGTGVGGGIIINDQVVAGSHGAGGEIGHAHVEDNMSEACNCGNYGCLEQFASATGIARMAREMLANTTAPSSLRTADKITAKTVFDAVKEGDPVAILVAERFGTYLGKTLAVLACVSDPQVIVIGGGVSKAGEVILDYIRKPFEKYAFTACRKTQFALATLGNDAGICGAAKMVL